MRYGKSGIKVIDRDAPQYIHARFAGLIEDDIELVDERLRLCDRFVKLASMAAIKACHDSDLRLPFKNPSRSGVIVSSNKGGTSTLEEIYIDTYIGDKRPKPIAYSASTASAFISILTGAKGLMLNLSVASVSGLQSLNLAKHYIDCGEVDLMLSGASEATVTRSTLAALNSVGVLLRNGTDPNKAYKVFDLNRNGMILGEGAAICVLESLENAVKRSAKIYAEVIGCGYASEAYHLYALSHDQDGLVRSMQNCISDAGISISDIDLIAAHGTGTKQNDVYETLAVKKVFGDLAYRVPMISLKPFTGHTLACAGVMDLCLLLISIDNGFIPPTLNLTTPDPECDLDYVPNKSRPASVKTILFNALGFGGYCSSLLLRRWE